MDIRTHPIWGKVSVYKKPAHLARFFLAKKWAQFYPRSMFVGVTGSVGKTTTVKACQAVLSQKFNTISTKENLDPIFNIPLTLLKIRPKIQKVILEMGVEYPGEMEYYLSFVRPSVGIITRIAPVHSEFLGDLGQVSGEKACLITQLPKDGYAILNGDDLNTRKLSENTRARVIYYGMNPDNCDVWAGNVKLGFEGTRFELNFGVERVEVGLKLIGRHLIYPALAAAALGVSCDMALLSIKKGLEHITPAENRLQVLDGLNGMYILNDTYNSSPVALEEAINVLNDLPARRRIVVLGEMRELGAYSEKLHRRIAQKIYRDKIDLVLLGIGDAKYIAGELIDLGFPADRIEPNLSNQQMVSKILKSAGKGDVVLVKGSRALRLDEVVKRITKH